MKRTLKEEVENFVKNTMHSTVEEWVTDTRFTDTSGCDGCIYPDRESAINAIILADGDEHQNAIDKVDGLMNDEEWVRYLIHGGVEEETAKKLINDKDWEEVIRIIVETCGPEWFLATYSGTTHLLSNDSILYY